MTGQFSVSDMSIISLPIDKAPAHSGEEEPALPSHSSPSLPPLSFKSKSIHFGRESGRRTVFHNSSPMKAVKKLPPRSCSLELRVPRGQREVKGWKALKGYTPEKSFSNTPEASNSCLKVVVVLSAMEMTSVFWLNNFNPAIFAL